MILSELSHSSSLRIIRNFSSLLLRSNSSNFFPKLPMVVSKRRDSTKKECQLKSDIPTIPQYDPNMQNHIDHRQRIFDDQLAVLNKLKASLPKSEIQVTLGVKNPTVKTFVANQDTPLSIAQGISKSLAQEAIISKVNGELWDLEKPLEADCTLEILKFNHPEAQQVFWHSSAHILGEALERLYGSYLCFGPPIAEGFFYDMFCGDINVSTDQFPLIEAIISEILKEKQPFEKLQLTKEQLKEMFNYSKYKLSYIDNKIGADELSSVYRCGSLIDLCPGPHIRHTGIVKALKIMQCSRSHWQGNTNNEGLQRIYGMSFPDKKQLDEYLDLYEKAKTRNHMKIGNDQQLFHLNPEFCSGSIFFEPRGTIIYNRMMEILRRQYRRNGFDEVMTPIVFKTPLWQISGHLEHYKDNMYMVNGESSNSIKKSEEQQVASPGSASSSDNSLALKPMNCPSHCLIYKHRHHSYRDLPIRYADFGVLHRKEASGALSGLTRVIRFQQDDAHIFCTKSQIGSEMNSCIEFLTKIYSILGFTFSLELSTRPENYIGSLQLWQEAEKSLEECLNANFGDKWRTNPGDGAFYGPKIDIHVKDSLKKSHQLATIQLDFNLPERFDLVYSDEQNQDQRPVIIHRAIYGSIERCFGILCEHYGGKWPIFLSPYQICLLPITREEESFTADLMKRMQEEADYQLCIDSYPADCAINGRVRKAQLAQYNFICVIGKQEVENDTVTVRTRDMYVHKQPIDAMLFTKVVLSLCRNYVTESKELFLEYLGKFDKSSTTNGINSLSTKMSDASI